MGLQGLLQYSPSAGSASPVLGRLVCKGGLEQDSLFTSRRTNQSLFAVLAHRLAVQALYWAAWSAESRRRGA